MITGHFAYWQKPWYRSKVHAMINGRIACGSRISKRSEFLWTNSQVECKRCAKAIEAKK